MKELYSLIKEDIGAWRGSAVGIKDVLLSFFDHTLLIVWIYRCSHYLHTRRCFICSRFLVAVNLILFGIEIGAHVKIGGGFRVHHPVGIVIGAKQIGRNFNVFSGVGCGGRSPDDREQPVIGDNVFLYAGAKILGGIFVGDNVVVGANAVVIESVPSDSLAVGVPARIVLRKKLH